MKNQLNLFVFQCEDDDECASLGAEACTGGECVNTPGSFECRCPPGSALDSTGRFCVSSQLGTCWTELTEGQCEASLPGASLKSECCCSLGLAWGSPCSLCSPEDCDCPAGMAKTDGKTCQDINECMMDPNICQGGGVCVNTEGSFTCNCPDGLTLDSSGNENVHIVLTQSS